VRRWALLPLRFSQRKKHRSARPNSHANIPQATLTSAVLSASLLLCPASYWAIVGHGSLKRCGRGHFDGLGCAYDAGRHFDARTERRGTPLSRSRQPTIGTGVLEKCGASIAEIRLIGMAWAVVLSVCVQIVLLIATASALLRISRSASGIRRQGRARIVAKRDGRALRYSRSPA